jgi:hypothetical protein
MMMQLGAARAINVLPTNKTMIGTPAANIMDNKPIVNIPPFGVCMSLANPTVASATAAAGRIDTDACIPNTVAPCAGRRHGCWAACLR